MRCRMLVRRGESVEVTEEEEVSRTDYSGDVDIGICVHVGTIRTVVH